MWFYCSGIFWANCNDRALQGVHGFMGVDDPVVGIALKGRS